MEKWGEIWPQPWNLKTELDSHLKKYDAFLNQNVKETIKTMSVQNVTENEILVLYMWIVKDIISDFLLGI